jgi:hypothetical protein
VAPIRLRHAAAGRLGWNFDILAETLGHNVKSALFGEIRL